MNIQQLPLEVRMKIMDQLDARTQLAASEAGTVFEDACGIQLEVTTNFRIQAKKHLVLVVAELKCITGLLSAMAATTYQTIHLIGSFQHRG